MPQKLRRSLKNLFKPKINSLKIKEITSGCYTHEGESRDTVTIIFYITGNYITRVSKSSTKFHI
jgi:hypothetical protein